MKSLRKTLDYLFYIFVFLLPWQTKLILRPAETNFNEIALFASHIILILLLLSFVVYIIKNKQGFHVKINRLWCLLAGLEIFALISVLVAPDKWLALHRYIIFLAALGMFYVLRNEIRKRSYDEMGLNKITLIYVFLSSVLLQSFLGIYQFLTQRSFAFKFLGLASHSPEVLGSAVVETISGRWLRAYGGLDHPNILGGVLAISLIIAACLLVRKKILNSQKQISESLYLFLFYFISLFALFFTFSRSAWIAFAVGMLVLLIVFIAKRDRWVIGRLIALIVFSGILLSTAIIPYYDILTARLQASGRLEQQSLNQRRSDYFHAREILEDNFTFGVGLGNYTKVLSDRDKNMQPAWYYTPIHNSFLLFLTETGLASFLFLVAFMSYLIIKKERREDFTWAVFVALIIIMLLDHWLLSLPFGMVFFFLVLGLI